MFMGSWGPRRQETERLRSVAYIGAVSLDNSADNMQMVKMLIPFPCSCNSVHMRRNYLDPLREQQTTAYRSPTGWGEQ